MKIKTIKPSFFRDKRGDYWTTWKKNYFNKLNFNHDKFSISKKNVLRGFHIDFKSWRMVTCIMGEVILYVVNFDKKSKNYLKKALSLVIHIVHFGSSKCCLSKFLKMS